jgi:tyrosinase
MKATSMTRREFVRTTTLGGGALLLSTSMPLQAEPASTLRMRRDIRNYNEKELEALRRAFIGLYESAGDNGYQKISGLHGEPDRYCHNDPTIFLPWHRAYVLRFEEALRLVDPASVLPFWEWTSDDAIANGMPRALSEPTVIIDGRQTQNPLHSAKIGVLNDRLTSRNPREPFRLGSLAQALTRCFNESTYDAFNTQLDFNPHGALHTWVRGDMGSVPYAAYDPIFWFHHCNVDRQWAQWQLGRNGADPGGEILEKELHPFGRTVKDVIRFREDLNYDYEGIEPMPDSPLHLLRDGSVMNVQNFTFSPQRDAVFLKLNDLAASGQSLNVDVFVNLPDANERTQARDNPHYAGSFGIFGGGHAIQPHDLAKSFRAVNLSAALSRLGIKSGDNVQIKLVVTDMEGRPVDVNAIPAKAISLTTE